MRVLLAVFSIALLALVAWAFARYPSTDAATAGGVVAAPAGASGAGSGEATAEPIAANRVVPKPVQRERGEVREAVEVVADPNAIELRVVRETDGQPVGGAEVGDLPDYTPEFWKRLSVADRQTMARGDMDFYRRRGRVQVTDAVGRCRVPRSEFGRSVLVVCDELYGTTYLRPDQESPVTVTLRVDRTLVVSVTDFDGAPAADVIVVLRRATKPQASRLRLGRTDARGELRQGHVQDYFTADSGGVVALTAEGLGIVSGTREVDLTADRSTAVDLVLPRSGSITFELVTDAGKRFDLTGFELPACSMGIHESRPDRGAAWQHLREVGRFDAQGRLTVRHVALGRFYSVHVRRLRSDPVVGVGPTEARPEIVAPIALLEGLVVFRGRAVDAAGEPITAERGVVFTFRHGRGFSSQESQIAADGGFLIPQPHLRSGTEVEISGRIVGEGTADLITRLTEPWTVRTGVNDLGVCEFTEAPVLLAGRLVVPPALDKLQQIWWQVEVKRRDWEQYHGLQTRWLGERRFEVRGAVAGDAELRLKFQTGVYRPLEPLVFRPGTRDVEIVLSTAGSLSVSFLVDGQGLVPALRLELEQEGAATPTDPHAEMMRRMQDTHRLQSGGEGRLVANWTGLLPGTYRLRLDCNGAEEPLVVISSIAVRGGVADDARLKDIDLRGRLRQIEIRVLDDTGRPLEQEGAKVVLTDARSGDWHAYALSKGAVELTIAQRATVRVLAKGFALVEDKDVTADREIRLTRPPAVRFLVKWPIPLPAGITPQLQVRPVLAKSARTPRFHLGGGSSGSLENHLDADGFIDAAGCATVRAMISGPQTLRIAMDPHGRGHMLHAITPRRVEITGQEQQDIVLTVDKGRLQAALDRIRNR